MNTKKMPNAIHIMYNEEKDETVIAYSEDWENLDNLQKLDNLKDALHMLEETYNDTLEVLHSKPELTTATIN